MARLDEKDKQAFFCIDISVFTEIIKNMESAMDTNIYPLEFLYDGNCPICRYDVVRLHNADRYGQLIFIDISAPDFDAEAYGRTRQMMLARIHARRADGVIVEGPEVFRLALTALGYGWLVAPTRWPVLNQVTEITYSWFARHRGSLARRFGRFYSRKTPECDLTCQSSGKRGNPNVSFTDWPQVEKAKQTPDKGKKR
jgi:predicted DCC family thiol-disulfide oxidoreductase YuxK